MFHKMPVILLSIMILLGIIHPFIPVNVQSLLYGISLSIKSMIVFVLPCIIFGLLFKTVVGLSRNASKIILLIVVAICLSNFFSTMISYSVGKLAYSFDLTMPFPQEASQLQPSFQLTLPKWIANDSAMLAGVLLGVILGRYMPSMAIKCCKLLESLIGFILRVIMYMIPLFISGFFIKMYHDNVILYIVQNYAVVFCLTASSLALYIITLYFLAHRGVSLSESLKNMLPAALAGFSSMSSAASMPLTLMGCEKNCQNADFSRTIIPATVNVHLVGDCFAIPIFAFAVLKSFGMPEPAFVDYLIFACYFVLAKFSVAAVPGGGILVMLPILEHYLGFDPTMLSLITALYILFDPIITSMNVLGNGGFAMMLNRVYSRKFSLS